MLDQQQQQQTTIKTPTETATATATHTTHVIDSTDVEFFLFKDLLDYVTLIQEQHDQMTVPPPFQSDVEFITVYEYLLYTDGQIDSVKKMFQAANFNKVETKQLFELLSHVYNMLEHSVKTRLQTTLDMAATATVRMMRREDEGVVDHHVMTNINNSNDDENSIENDLSSKQLAYVPRIIRLSQKLQLTEKETKAFLYILVSQCGTHYPSMESSSMLSVASGMGKFAGMNMRELLDFLSPQRLHNKQGLVEVDNQYRDTLSSGVIKMPKECMQALVGSEISSEEFLKIDKTALADVLLEEPGFSLHGITAMRGEDGDFQRKSERSGKKSEEESEEELEFGSDEDVDGEFNDLVKQMAEEDGDLESNEFDLYDFLKTEQNKQVTDDIPKTGGKSSIATTSSSVNKIVGSDEQFLSPYSNDIEYLDDRFQFLSSRIKVRNMESEKKEQESDVGYKMSRERSTDSILRELMAKERMLRGKCIKRLEATKFVPRLERLAKIRNLDEFEKWILLLLVSAIISHDVNIAMTQSYSIRSPKDINVGFILWVLCSNLEERLNHRKYFYKKSALVKDGMIRISDQLSGDLTECAVNIDRRMLDYIAGLDSEFSEIVEGSNLYLPQVKLENVVLPEEQKKLVIDTVANFDTYKQHRKKLGFDDLISYGTSITMLFFGEPGTGKTMMANALANYLGKKLLLVNFSNLGAQAGELLKFIFREAKINDALLFFDECESFFESRKKGTSDVASLLTEIEKHDGLIILATNRAFELDEAMHRRITLSVEFKSPDPLLRRVIWEKHFPEGIKLADDIDFDRLSMNFELTGGLIKNAVLSALSFAVARDGRDPIIQEKDLERAAKIQMQGIMQMNEFDRRVIPTRGVRDIIIPKNLETTIQEIISFEKARKILVGQWGFDERGSKHAMTILIHGPPGTGKSLCAEVLGFECGLPLKIVDVSEILSKYAYNTTKNLDTLFRETKKTGAILVLELSINDPQKLEKSIGLFSNLEHFNGILIMITNVENMLNDPILRKFKFVLEFTVPSRNLRKRLWRKIIPEKTPLSDDINWDLLANDFEFTGGQIENCVFRACARACLSDTKQLSMQHLKEACLEEQKHGTRTSGGSMYH